ncbi:hypothetical protein NDU88_001501 [Pleurodeles waltl]|uniref:Uncharacterized protein n=1 Tax=Pleurodeles waltl TaxID=8319 RepID=A0AAV7NAX1_PLEWA|nr:hypothetical protein NDU88_001501 [Pleurodeles waltl]
MRVFTRLIMTHPKAKGFGWKGFKNMAGIVDVPYRPLSTGPDFSLSTPLLYGACSEADPRVPKRLITSFYQKMDKVPPVQQIAEQIELEELLGTEGTVLEEDDGSEPCGGCAERISETRADEGAKTALAGPSAQPPVCKQTHRKS